MTMPDQPVCIEAPQVLDFCSQPEHFDSVCTPLGSCTPPRGSTVKCTVLSGTSGTLGGALSFEPAVNYPVGILPEGITASDFNGDGIVDLAVTNRTDNSVSILLGKGDGTFIEPAPAFAVGSSPIGITAADFNGDDKIDLATANNGSSNVSVLLGNGDGTFIEPAPVYPGGPIPDGMATADFNGDGIIDLAVANFVSPGEVSILLGNGNGTFTPAPSSPVPTGGQFAAFIAAADFNGDGIIDLAVTDFGTSDVSILLADGNGIFTLKGTHPR